MKKLFTLLIVIAMLCSLLAGCGAVKSNDNNSNDTDDNNTNDAAQENADASTYISLDINPEISMTINEQSQVTGIFAENEDAQVLLYGEESLVGLNLDEAIEKITSLAVELGYIDEENKVVGVMVSTENEDEVPQIVSIIDEKIKKVASEKALEIEISEEGAYSLLCSLEEFKSQHPENEKIQKLNPAEFKLAKTAFESGEMTIEEAIEMDRKELINRVNNAFNRIEKFATKSYDEAKKNAEIAYELAVNTALEGVYSEIYFNNIEKYPTTYYYGVLYQLYMTTQRGYIQLSEKLAKIEEINNCALSEEQAQRVADALGVENVEEIMNESGEVTVDSIENYADKKIKNSNKSQEINEFKDKFKESIKGIKTDINKEIEDRRNQYNEDTNGTSSSAIPILKALEAYGLLLNDESKNELEGYIKEYVEIISQKALTSQKASEIADIMKTKANEILKKIENDLTDEDKGAVEARKQELEQSINEAKEAFEKEVDDARKQAQIHLEERKNNRKHR